MRSPASIFCVTAFAFFAAQGLLVAQEKPAAAEEKKPGILGRVTRIFTSDKKEEAKPAPAPVAKPKAAEEPPARKSASSSSSTTPGPKPKMKSTGTGAGKSKGTSSITKSSVPSKPKPKAKPAAPSTGETAKGETKKEEAKPAPAVAEKKETPGAATPTPAPAGDGKDKPAADPAATAKKEDKPAGPADAKVDGSSKDPAGSMKHGSGEFDDISAAFGTKQDMPPPAPAAQPKTDAPKPPPEITASTLPPPPPLPASDGSWEIVKLDHDYVTADSMQRFYRFNTLKVDGKHVWMRSAIYILKAEIGSQELLINNTKFILSFPVAQKNGKALFSRLDLCKLIDPVLVPNHITTAEIFDTVIIDAGHGGHDSGARGIYGYEKDFTLKMASALRDALTKRGFKTLLTRSTDEFISLPGRVQIANATPRSIFISLHFNSSGPSATGIETWALSPQGTASTFMGQRNWDAASFKGNNRDSENIALATAVHAMVIHSLSTLADRGIVNRSLVDRGIKRARWTVLTGCNRPGILFEGGFVTNATEGRLIAAQTYRDYLCNAIADAVMNYRKALHPNVARPSIKR